MLTAFNSTKEGAIMSDIKALSGHELKTLIETCVRNNEFAYAGDDTVFELTVKHESIDAITAITVHANSNIKLLIEEFEDGGHTNEYYFSDTEVINITYKDAYNGHLILSQTDPVELNHLSQELVEILNGAGLHDFYDEYGAHIKRSNAYASV